jgi:hypothetical protein
MSSLIDMYVQTFNEDGYLQFLGRVKQKVSDEYYLTVWYSAFTGEAMHHSLCSLKEMTSWKFYHDEELFSFYNKKEHARLKQKFHEENKK